MGTMCSRADGGGEYAVQKPGQAPPPPSSTTTTVPATTTTVLRVGGRSDAVTPSPSPPSPPPPPPLPPTSPTAISYPTPSATPSSAPPPSSPASAANAGKTIGSPPGGGSAPSSARRSSHTHASSGGSAPGDPALGTGHSRRHSGRSAIHPMMPPPAGAPTGDSSAVSRRHSMPDAGELAAAAAAAGTGGGEGEATPGMAAPLHDRARTHSTSSVPAKAEAWTRSIVTGGGAAGGGGGGGAGGGGGGGGGLMSPLTSGRRAALVAPTTADSTNVIVAVGALPTAGTPSSGRRTGSTAATGGGGAGAPAVTDSPVTGSEEGPAGEYPPLVMVDDINDRYLMQESSRLGAGSFGEVYLGWRRVPRATDESVADWEARIQRGPQVAIKRMKPTDPRVAEALKKFAATGLGLLRARAKFNQVRTRRSIQLSRGDAPGHHDDGTPAAAAAAGGAGAATAAAAAVAVAAVAKERAGGGGGGDDDGAVSSRRPTPPLPRAAGGLPLGMSAATGAAAAAAAAGGDGGTRPRRATAPGAGTGPEAAAEATALHAEAGGGGGGGGGDDGEEVTIEESLLVKDRDNMHKEAAFFKAVRGSEHVVEIQDHCDDGTYVYIVLEYCPGGDLMRYVSKCRHFSERVASYLFRQMLLAVMHCHARGVAHRDLKPEQFLFMSETGKAHLKLTDFGLAAHIDDETTVLTDGVGSAYFIAPEVFRRHYTASCDAWSLGIILYLLLSGTVPFGAKAKVAKEVHRAIRNDPLVFTGRAWTRVSPAARELVAGLLEKAPYKRYTLREALAHPWVAGEGVSDAPLESAIVSSMVAFDANNRLRREALRIVSSTLSAAEVRTLRAAFYAIDKNADQTISLTELTEALASVGLSAAGRAVEDVMRAVDNNGDGMIDIEEFLAATTELQIIHHQQQVWAAFSALDKDGDGFIDVAEARTLMGLEGDDTTVAAYISEWDRDHDGRISYEEFIRMLVPKNTKFSFVRFT